MTFSGTKFSALLFVTLPLRTPKSDWLNTGWLEQNKTKRSYTRFLGWGGSTACLSMFAKPSVSRLEASEAAGKQAQAYESVLALRIQLQKVVDAANVLPSGSDLVARGKEQSDEVIEAYHKLSTSLDGTVRQLTALLHKQAPSSSSSASSSSSSSLSWEEVLAPQQRLRPHWESTLDKWNARLHFGSERKQSKLKIFNHKIWEQISVALSDKQRAIEKSRLPMAESQRLDRTLGGGGGGSDEDNNKDSEEEEDDDDEEEEVTKDRGKKRRVGHDLEVYDDRSFYSLLLKSFIQSAESSSASASSMRPDDLAALRKYRRGKTKVDRKASKGRKIRYVTHAKLQNFMFPIAQPSPPMDVDRLFQSLFQ
jgi:protein AATF/BFR2